MKVISSAVLSLLVFLSLIESNAQRFSASSVISVPGLMGNKVYPADYDNDGDEDILFCGTEMNIPVLKLFETNNGALQEKQNI